MYGGVVGQFRFAGGRHFRHGVLDRVKVRSVCPIVGNDAEVQPRIAKQQSDAANFFGGRVVFGRSIRPLAELLHALVANKEIDEHCRRESWPEAAIAGMTGKAEQFRLNGLRHIGPSLDMPVGNPHRHAVKLLQSRHLRGDLAKIGLGNDDFPFVALVVLGDAPMSAKNRHVPDRRVALRVVEVVQGLQGGILHVCPLPVVSCQLKFVSGISTDN